MGPPSLEEKKTQKVNVWGGYAMHVLTLPHGATLWAHGVGLEGVGRSGSQTDLNKIRKPPGSTLGSTPESTHRKHSQGHFWRLPCCGQTLNCRPLNVPSLRNPCSLVPMGGCHWGHARKQAIKQPTKAQTSTLSLVSSRTCLQTLLGRFAAFTSMGHFPSESSCGRCPSKTRPIECFLAIAQTCLEEFDS